MKVVYLSLVLLFSWEAKSVHSYGTPDAEGRGGTTLRVSSPPDSSPNPCDGLKIWSGSSDAHLSCESECIALRPEVRSSYNMYPNHLSTNYLYQSCGKNIEGKCSIATGNPVCWCHSSRDSNDQRPVTLSNCRTGIQLVRQFISAAAKDVWAQRATKQPISGEGEREIEAVAMHQFPEGPIPTRPRSDLPKRPNTRLFATPTQSSPSSASSFSSASSGGPYAGPSSYGAQQGEEEDWNSKPDNEPEGKYFCTDVRIGGVDVRAMLDTGSASTLIHDRFKINMVSTEQTFFNYMNRQSFQVFGRTTVNVDLKKGVRVAITGFVTSRKYDLLLGNDFFLAHRAKIRVSDRKMDLTIGSKPVMMTVKFRPIPHSVLMMATNSATRNIDPLHIEANLNGVNTRALVDTGATITVANRNLVNKQNLRSISTRVSFGGAAPVNLERTDVVLQLGTVRFYVPAVVPQEIPTIDLLIGNDFNKDNLDVIDYQLETVTFKVPGGSGYNRVTTRAILYRE